MDDIEVHVRATGRRVSRHKAERAEHIAAVVAALNAGKRPTDVAAWSPFTPAHLRKIARDKGVPPSENRGPAPRSDSE